MLFAQVQQTSLGSQRNALCFPLRSLHLTNSADHVTQEQCCAIKHAQEYRAILLTKAVLDKIHFPVKFCHTFLLVNEIEPLEIPKSVTGHSI
jgi:hypothetical protein